MNIVPQPASASYSRLLALPAPKIAGLLPSGLKPTPAPFVFDRPVLAELSVSQRERLYEAAAVLLEIAVEFMVGTFNEAALRAAEVMFHRAAGGASAIRSVGMTAFNAEVDADWFEFVANARRARPLSDTQAESIIAQVRARRESGAA